MKYDIKKTRMSEIRHGDPIMQIADRHGRVAGCKGYVQLIAHDKMSVDMEWHGDVIGVPVEEHELDDYRFGRE